MNLYGATKLCSDKLFVAANAFVAQDEARFSVVRYGNVMGSRGSVIPLFLKQRETGRLTVTDPRMTRFWITLEQGSSSCCAPSSACAGARSSCPSCPSTNIMDIAAALAPDAQVDIIGIRPGEKIHETMVTMDDARNTLEYEDYYEILPDHEALAGRYKGNGGKPVAQDFVYDSESNPWTMGADELGTVFQTLDVEH